MPQRVDNPIGIFSWFGYPVPPTDRLRLIRDAGFQSVAVWWGIENSYIKSTLSDMVRDLGLVLDNVHAPFDNCNDFWSDSAEARENIVSRHLRWIEECARYSIPKMVIHLARGLRREPPTPDGLKCLERIVQAAASAGIVIVAENTRSVDYLDVAFAEIQSPNFRFCYDSSHDWIYSPEKTLLLKNYGDRLAVTHFSDNGGKIDNHWLPGDGVVDWDSVAEAFPKATYNGSFMLEVVPSRQQKRRWHDAEAFLAEAYKRAAWLAGLFGGRLV